MESQKHGFIFQEQILNRIGMSNDLFSYTHKWDIPNISIKSFLFKSKMIEFGSIERMFNIEEDFGLIIIGYNQVGNLKKVILSDYLHIKRDLFKKIKGNLTLEDIHILNEELKKFKNGEHEKARDWAVEQKKIFNSKTDFDIRFKIDSKKQRRIQCALNIYILYNYLEKPIDLKNKLNILVMT